jgi:hypothetical protein
MFSILTSAKTIAGVNMKSCYQGAYTVSNLIALTYNDYIGHEYALPSIQHEQLINGIYYAIAQKINLKEKTIPQDINHVLNFVFAHNKPGLTDHLLPRDAYDFFQQDLWIKKRIRFLQEQPALPLLINEDHVRINQQGLDLEQDLDSFQKRINQAFLRTAPAIITHLKRPNYPLLIITYTLVTSALLFSYNAALIIVLLFFCFRLYQRQQRLWLTQHYQQLNNRKQSKNKPQKAFAPLALILNQPKLSKRPKVKRATA